MPSEIIVYSGISRSRPCAVDPKDGLLYQAGDGIPGTKFPSEEAAKAAIQKTVAARQAKFGPTGDWIENYSTTPPRIAANLRKADFREEQAERKAERLAKGDAMKIITFGLIVLGAVQPLLGLIFVVAVIRSVGEWKDHWWPGFLMLTVLGGLYAALISAVLSHINRCAL